MIVRNKEIPRLVSLCALVQALFNLAACSTAPVRYIHPTYDFSLIQKVAVIPLENFTQDQQAGERVRRIVVSELLAAGVLDVVEPGQVNRALAQQNIQSVSSVSAKQMEELGKNLGVQAFIVGSLDTYDRINVGGTSFAEVAITLRAIDAASGSVIWSTSQSSGGVSVVGRLFGLGGLTMNEAVQLVVRNAVTTLFQ